MSASEGFSGWSEMLLLSEVVDDSHPEVDRLCLVFPVEMTVMNLGISLMVGSKTSRRSGKEPALPVSGRHVDWTRESGVNRARFHQLL